MLDMRRLGNLSCHAPTNIFSLFKADNLVRRAETCFDSFVLFPALWTVSNKSFYWFMLLYTTKKGLDIISPTNKILSTGERKERTKYNGCTAGIRLNNDGTYLFKVTLSIYKMNRYFFKLFSWLGIGFLYTEAPDFISSGPMPRTGEIWL